MRARRPVKGVRRPLTRRILPSARPSAGPSTGTPCSTWPRPDSAGSPPVTAWHLAEDRWTKYYKPDVEKTKKLLAEAGYAAGFTITLGVISTFPTMVNSAPVVAANLKRIGINAEIDNVAYAVWITRWLAKDFAMTMNTTPGYCDPDTAFFPALHSTKGQTWNSWSVPDLDGLLEEDRRTFDSKKWKEIDPGERAASLAPLHRPHRLHAGLRQELEAAPDHKPLESTGAHVSQLR